MADNVEITAGTGTDIATDDVGGVHYQRVKIDLGGDGAASPLVRGQQTSANSIPIVLASDQSDLDVAVNGNIGQQAKAGSLPVTLASDEDNLGVVGAAANDAAVSGNPVRIGGKYKTPADNDDVDSGDTVDLLLDDVGAVVLGQHPGAWDTNDNWSAAQTNTQIKAAPGTGLALCVTSLTFSSDGQNAGSVSLVEDTSGTPVTRAGPYYFPASAGIMTIPFPDPIKISANKNLGVTSTGVNNLTVTTTGRTKAVAA
jgi:hypothetical protein